MKTPLLLASNSPRRKALLQQIGVSFEPRGVEIDETPHSDEPPRDYVLRLARQKAQAAWQRCVSAYASEQAQQQVQHPDVCILAADTCVSCDQQIFGKPTDLADSQAMLQRLSDRSHQVITAVALKHGDKVLECVVETRVTFRSLSEAEIQAYWQSGEPQDKAGSYGIQGLGAIFVKDIQGSYSNVVGLPLCESAELLRQFDIPIWQPPA